MIARCARCQGTFTTDRFGLQRCPHCGAELMLADPNAPPAGVEAPAAPQPPPGGPSASEAPPGSGGAEPPAGPPSGAEGPPAGPPPPPSGGGFVPPPPSGAAWPELPSPFADRGRRGFLAGFFETWKLVATQPAQFFRRVRIDQTGAAVLFGVVASTVGNVAAALYAFLSGQQAIAALEQVVKSMPEEQARFVRLYMQGLSGGGTIAQAVAAPLLALIGIYVGAAILHLLLMLFRGSNRGFDATLTAVAYASGLNLLLAVPGCGGLVAGVWGLVALIIGLGEVQRCGTGKSAAAVLAPAVAACVLCCCVVFGIGAPALLKGMQEASEGVRETNL
jgi:hypothetical protein